MDEQVGNLEQVQHVYNPFPPGNAQISPKELTIEQKIHIVDSIIRKENTISTASTRFNLPYKYVWKLKDKYLKRGFFHWNNGRPRCIDEEGFQTLVNFTAEIDPNELQLKHAISEEHIHTVERRLPGLDLEEVKPMSRRSAGRYYRRVISHDPAFVAMVD